MKFLVVIVGIFAVGNAAVVLRLSDPSVIPTVVSPVVDPIVSPVVPGIIPSVVPSVVPGIVPATELYDWEAYKVRFNQFRSFNVENQIEFRFHWRIVSKNGIFVTISYSFSV